jgi:hypothetical protein
MMFLAKCLQVGSPKKERLFVGFLIWKVIDFWDPPAFSLFLGSCRQSLGSKTALQ